MLNMPSSLSKITLSSPEQKVKLPQRTLEWANGLPIAELTDAPHRIALKAMGGSQPLGREPLRK
jgi:hypothetical protein